MIAIFNHVFVFSRTWTIYCIYCNTFVRIALCIFKFSYISWLFFLCLMIWAECSSMAEQHFGWFLGHIAESTICPNHSQNNGQNINENRKARKAMWTKLLQHIKWADWVRIIFCLFEFQRLSAFFQWFRHIMVIFCLMLLSWRPICFWVQFSWKYQWMLERPYDAGVLVVGVVLDHLRIRNGSMR